MALTLVELYERLKDQDQSTLVDWLGLTVEDILDRFEDVIEDKFDELEQKFEEEAEED